MTSRSRGERVYRAFVEVMMWVAWVLGVLNLVFGETATAVAFTAMSLAFMTQRRMDWLDDRRQAERERAGPVVVRMAQGGYVPNKPPSPIRYGDTPEEGTTR